MRNTLLLGCRDDAVGVQHEVRALDPVVLDLLQRVANHVVALSLRHDRDEVVVEAGVGRSEDERVVALVDVGREERRSLGVGARDGKVLDAHDVVLQADSEKAVDVLRDRDEHFAGHLRVGSRVSTGAPS